VDVGRDVVSAEGVDARSPALRPCPCARGGAFSGEMALGADAGASGASGGYHDHRRPHRCGVRRCDRISRSAASPRPAVRSGHFVAPDRLPRHAPGRGADRGEPAQPAGHPIPAPRSGAPHRDQDVGAESARASVADGDVAQRASDHALAGRACRRRGDTGPRVAPRTPPARSLTLGAAPGRQPKSGQVFLHPSLRHHVAATPGLARAPALGHRATIQQRKDELGLKCGVYRYAQLTDNPRTNPPFLPEGQRLLSPNLLRIIVTSPPPSPGSRK